MAITMITVTGTYLLETGGPASGQVDFMLSASLQDAAAKRTYAPIVISAPLVGGAFSVALVATNDPSSAPTGLTYLVTPRIVGATTQIPPYSIVVPYTSTLGTADLSALAPVANTAVSASYVLLTAVGAPNGVASLDGTGKVPAAQIPASAGSIAATTLSAKGSLIGASAAGTPADVPVGTTGQILTAVPANASGIGWTTPTGGAGGADAVVVVAASGTTQTFTLPAGGLQTWDVTLTANMTPTFAGATTAKACTTTLFLRQDTTGSRLVPWPSNVAWVAQSAPLLSTVAGRYDIVQLVTLDAGTTYTGLLVASGVQSNTVPGAPTALSAATGNAQSVLAWTAPVNTGGLSITNYKVYRSTTTNTEVLVATVGNVLTYTDTALTNGTAYFYKVTAVNSLGESALSNEATVTPAASTAISDAFARVATTTGLGIADSGQTWLAGQGTFGIDSSHMAYSVSNVSSDCTFIDLGKADMTVQVTVSLLVAATSMAALARVTSANTFYYATADIFANNFTVYKLNAGTATQIGTTQAYTFTAGDIIEISCIGSTISGRVIRAAATLVSTSGTDTTFATQTKCGIRPGYTGSGGSRISKFTAV